MSADAEAPDNLIGIWIGQGRSRNQQRVKRWRPAAGTIRFAFYGRMSTEDYQDRRTSHWWQREFALQTIDGHGAIVAEFFDVGYSRELPWPNRPQAAALLAALADPNRGFDAIVIGEYERAFYADQFQQMAPIFRRHGVAVWLAELDGPVDFDSDEDKAVMRLLGIHSKREVLRARFRTHAAMRAQVMVQGRHQGGRPPYGYRLADAGPHPNRVEARYGKRLHRLEPDPVTAPHVAWIFMQRLAGHSITSITRNLNDNGIPCPSNYDPQRNPHRSGTAWMWTTVTAILGNPRYTGRQTWGRQRCDRELAPYADDLLGQVQVRRWNDLQEWIVSSQPAHPALVSERDFIAVQEISAIPVPNDGIKRDYALVGLLRCQLCGRVFDSAWIHGRAGYRCRHGHRSTRAADPNCPKIFYIREDKLVEAVGPLTGLTGISARDLANYLRSNGLVIERGDGTTALRTAESMVKVPQQRGNSKTHTGTITENVNNFGVG